MSVSDIETETFLVNHSTQYFTSLSDRQTDAAGDFVLYDVVILFIVYAQLDERNSSQHFRMHSSPLQS